MTFNLKKEILLILSLSFTSIAFGAKNEGEDCRSDQECSQGLYCTQQVIAVRATGNIDSAPSKCSRSRDIQFSPPPSTSITTTGQSHLLTPAPASTANAGQSQLLTPTPVATPARTDAFGQVNYVTNVPVSPRAER